MAIENPFKGMPKWAIWASLAGGTAVTGYALWRHHQTTGSWSPFATSTTASASSQDTDPVTGLPYSQDNATDPLTGLTYLAEAEQYGSVQAAEASVSQFGATVTSGNGTTTTAYGTPGTTTTASGGVSASTYTSNAAWSQSVQAGLTDIGYNPTDVASALGLYLTGQPLTAAQAQIVNAAIAEYGPPPVGTFQVIQAPAAGPATTATVPGVVGKSTAEAVSAIQAAGLVAGAHSTQAGTVNGQSPAAGKVVAINSTVDLSVAAPATEVTVPNVTGLGFGDAYNHLTLAGLKSTPGAGQEHANYKVTAQSPAAGAKVASGSTVKLTVKA